MNREELKELGLTDEQVEAVMASHGKVFNPVKQNLESVTTDRDSLKVQLTDRDAQLEALGKVDPGALQAEIERLKDENAETTTKMQEKLDAQAFDFALDKTLTASGARNSKAIKALLDNEIIKLGEDGNLIGLSEQLTNLKESDGYLFADEKQIVEPVTPNIYAPGSQQRTNTPNPVDPKEAGRQKALERHMKEEK